jgi:hypothetical protein
VSRAGRVAARAALRLYPPQWRRRYGAELHDLVEDADSSLADAADIVAAALREHLKGGTPMRSEIAHRHPGTFALVGALVLAPTMAIVALSVLGHELGFSAVATAVDPVVVAIGRVGVLDLALVAAPAVALVLAILPLLEVRLDHPDGASALMVRLRAVPANMAVALLALVVGVLLAGHIVSESVLELRP